MWESIKPPGEWILFLQRKDIKNLPIMEARKKYMQEQLLFENYVSSLQTLNTLNTTNTTSPSSGGGPSGTPSGPLKDLCGVYNDGSYYNTLVVVEGGDEYISSTYYMYYEGFNEWFEDRENAYVLAWDGSNWGIYYYSDVAAGIWVEGITYTNYLGDSYTSNGPEFEVVTGGTNPNDPIGAQFDDFYIIANPCTADAGKELEYDQYHIISLAYKPSSNPELVPDYMGPIGTFNNGYPTLYKTGSDFFASQSSEPYYRSTTWWNQSQTSYQTNINVYGTISSSFFSQLTQPLYNQSTDVVGDYNDGVKLGVAKARIEQGTIPNVVSYSDTYSGGKGTTTVNLDYVRKDSSGIAEYEQSSLYHLKWNGSIWVLTDGVVSGSGSSVIDNASGTYDLNATIHTVSVLQTNANG